MEIGVQDHIPDDENIAITYRIKCIDDGLFGHDARFSIADLILTMASLSNSLLVA